MKKMDFLTLQGYSEAELWEILKATLKFKEGKMKDKQSQILDGSSFLLLFQKASTRTRLSFEVAINQLGGHSVYLGWAESQLGRGETVADSARVLSRYVDCIIARVYKQSVLEELAEKACIPIINALSNLYHPCQALADLFTIWEKKGHIRGLKVSYIGDGNNVCNSLLIICSKLGVNLSVACPEGNEPFSEAIEFATKNSLESGATIEIVREPAVAVKETDIVYSDTFISMGDELDRETKIRNFMPKYQVNSRLLENAKADVLFMHCLPAHRGEEVTDEVIDGSRSVVWDQAENRLHTSKAILTRVIP